MWKILGREHLINAEVTVSVVLVSSWRFLMQVTAGVTTVTLSNVTPSNNLLLDSYFENHTIELHVLYILNMNSNFYANWM